MRGKKWIATAVTVVGARHYPVLRAAVLFAMLPVLARMGSSYVEGELLLNTGHTGVRSMPVMSMAVFLPSLVGFVKYASRSHVLAYALWLTTYLSVAVLGIVMFEAFSPPHQWSGSLFLPGLVVVNCCSGTIGGAGLMWMASVRRRTGSGIPS
jgi:hypothetical protein